MADRPHIDGEMDIVEFTADGFVVRTYDAKSTPIAMDDDGNILTGEPVGDNGYRFYYKRPDNA